MFKTKLKAALTVTALVAGTAGLMLLGAGAASAQGTATPWAPGGADQDLNAAGGLTFYNSAGQVITGGPVSSLFASYIQGRTTLRSGDTKAIVNLYVPQVGQTPDNWATFDTHFAAGTYPVPVTAPIPATTLPVDAEVASDHTPSAVATSFPQTATAAGYVDAYEVREFTNSAGNSQTANYNYADIVINTGTTTVQGVAPGTWGLIWTPGNTDTSTTVSATPNPVNTSTNTTFTATVSPAGVGGTVVFTIGGVATAPFNVVNGVATATVPSQATQGTESFSAAFTPTAGSAVNPSASAAGSLTVQAPLPGTTTAIAVTGPGAGTALADTTITVTVGLASGPGTPPAGTVAVTENNVAVPGLTLTGPTNGVYTYDDPAGFSATSHTLKATFTPGAGFQGSSGTTTFSPQAAVPAACLLPGSKCTDPQSIDVNVPAGSLVISTPYNGGTDPTQTLHMGDMTLQVDATSGVQQFEALAPFAGIKVIDTRPGTAGWTAAAQSSDFTGGASSIDSQNVGLYGVGGTPDPGFVGTPVVFTDNRSANPAVAPAAAPVVPGGAGLGLSAHTFGSVGANGQGTFTFNGTLSIFAPTSTHPGLYSGTVTFTVSG